MAQPRGRRDPGRGRSRAQGSGQRQARQPAQRGARGARGGQAGYGGRGSGGRGNGAAGGGNNTAIIAVIALGGVAVVVILILLITSGKDDPGHQVPMAKKATPEIVHPAGPPPDAPPKPLTPAEKTRVTETIDRLHANMPEARRLHEEAMRDHQNGDREEAQEGWRRARDMLHGMIEEGELLFEAIGDERVESYARRHYDIHGEWSDLLSQFVKYIE